MTNDSKRAVEAAAPALAGLLLAIPVLVAYYPPMTDLPFHEAAIGILRHFGDTTMFPSGLYERNLGEPNQLFHMLGWALSYAVSTRWAVKLIVAAAVVAIPVCAARLARHAGASPLSALLVAPMSLGWLFSWGLVANLLGLAVFLAAAPMLDRFARAPTGRGAVATTLAIVLLYFAHGAMMAVYAGAALGLAVAYPYSRKGTALRLVPFCAGLAMTVAEALWVAHLVTQAVRGMPRLWHPLWYKLSQIPHIILPATEISVKYAMFCLCALIIGLFLWLRTRERREHGAALSSQRSKGVGARRWALMYRWELFAAACFVAFLAFPLTLSGTTLVYQRWFPPGFAVLAVVAAPRDLWTRRARVALFAIIVLPIATLLVAWPSFADSNREYMAFERVLPYIDPGSAVASLNLGPTDHSRLYSLDPAAGRILATRGGRLAYAFTDSPISPVIIPRRFQWSESLLRLAFDSYAFRPAHDMHRFRYVLLCVNHAGLEELATFALAPEAEYVMHSGRWVLFRSRWPTLPLASRDVRIQGPPPANLRELIDAMVRSLNDDRTVQVPRRPLTDPTIDPTMPF